MAAAKLEIIDTHLHIWQRSRFAYHWLEAGSDLDRDFRLEDIRREMAALNVVGGLLMEATNTPQEIPWLLAICEADPRCLGVIGWISLDEADASAQIHRFAQHSHFKGVRLNWLTSRPETHCLLAAMQTLQEHKLVVDVLAHCDFLPQIAAFICQYPDVTFVLDHLGGVPIHESGLSKWFDVLSLFAPLPNTVVKFSGYIAASQRPTVSILRDYLDMAVETVGSERLMFGSNWPIFLNTATYTETIRDLQNACTHLETAAQTALFYNTAAVTYKLTHKKETVARP